MFILSRILESSSNRNCDRRFSQYIGGAYSVPCVFAFDLTDQPTDAPVDADGGQIEYRCRAAHDVECHPSVAQRVAELPLRVVHLQTTN